MKLFAVLFLLVLFHITFVNGLEESFSLNCQACTERMFEGYCAKRSGSFCAAGNWDGPYNSAVECDNWIYVASQCVDGYVNTCERKNDCVSCVTSSDCIYLDSTLLSSYSGCIAGDSIGAHYWTGKRYSYSTVLTSFSQCPDDDDGNGLGVLIIIIGLALCCILFLCCDRSKRGKKRRKNICFQLKYICSSGGSRRRANEKRDQKENKKKEKKAMEKLQKDMNMQGMMLVPMTSTSTMQPQPMVIPMNNNCHAQPMMVPMNNNGKFQQPMMSTMQQQPPAMIPMNNGQAQPMMIPMNNNGQFQQQQQPMMVAQQPMVTNQQQGE
eukprot:TRINITY_DN2922_c0_g2_i1.p1 TRINITY_DN2922_c0_g2~~TRINITY_DN2922_c0_g2_i1.p1  ORF type:complete len:324 (+),score=87.63 TRINITY_DN2922_c0_g2_i1:96-1067(+)